MVSVTLEKVDWGILVELLETVSGKLDEQAGKALRDIQKSISGQVTIEAVKRMGGSRAHSDSRANSELFDRMYGSDRVRAPRLRIGDFIHRPLDVYITGEEDVETNPMPISCHLGDRPDEWVVRAEYGTDLAEHWTVGKADTGMVVFVSEDLLSYEDWTHLEVIWISRSGKAAKVTIHSDWPSLEDTYVHSRSECE